MKICELTIQAFSEYTKNSPLANYMQTEEYARFMGEEKYNYDYVGLVDESGVIKAASLILWKRIGLMGRYGYAPKGFLVNYYDEALMKTFATLLEEYYAKKGVVFIKINPEIVVAQVDNKKFASKDNPNMRLKQDIQRYGYVKLKDNLYFESINPRFNAYVNLKNARLEDYSKANRNKVKNARRKGLYVEIGGIDDIEKFYRLDNRSEPLTYYRNMYTAFEGKIDLVLVKVNYENFVKNSQELYEEELDRNSLYNEVLHRSKKESDLHRKMASDSRLLSIKNEIVTATEGIRLKEDPVVAGALVIKNGNRVHIVASSFSREYPNLNANYYLYDALIQNYKVTHDYLDLGGVCGDFRVSCPYHGLNNFKLGFNADVYEYIGEFDLVFNRVSYEGLLSSGKLANEFNKKVG